MPFWEEEALNIVFSRLWEEDLEVFGEAATSGGGDVAASGVMAGQGGGKPDHRIKRALKGGGGSA